MDSSIVRSPPHSFCDEWISDELLHHKYILCKNITKNTA